MNNLRIEGNRELTMALKRKTKILIPNNSILVGLSFDLSAAVALHSDSGGNIALGAMSAKEPGD
jgi:hypothetical protein